MSDRGEISRSKPDDWRWRSYFCREVDSKSIKCKNGNDINCIQGFEYLQLLGAHSCSYFHNFNIENIGLINSLDSTQVAPPKEEKLYQNNKATIINVRLKIYLYICM